MAAGSDQQTSELAALREEHGELRRELMRKSFRIGELEEELVELARSYEESLSWRLTRPIRSLKPRLKKLLG